MIDTAAQSQCTPRKDDPLVLGYFVGNEPPWDDRETEVVDMILAGPADWRRRTSSRNSLPPATTPKRRKEFVIGAFEKLSRPRFARQ